VTIPESSSLRQNAVAFHAGIAPWWDLGVPYLFVSGPCDSTEALSSGDHAIEPEVYLTNNASYKHWNVNASTCVIRFYSQITAAA
jgi:hypothetical protein